MNYELVDVVSFNNGTKLINQGGDSIKLGISNLLQSRDKYAADPNSKGGKNCSEALNSAIKRLQEDPYLCLGLSAKATSSSEIKKAYRKLALKFHPDKNPSTSLLFTAIQDAYDILSNDESRNVYDIRRRRQEASMDKLRKQKSEAPPTSNNSNNSRPYSAKKRYSKPAAAASESSNTNSTPNSNSNSNSTQPQNRSYGGSSPQPTPFPDRDTQNRTRAGKMPTPRAENWGEGQQSGQSKHDEAANAAERLRQFNRKFYQEFRQNAQNGGYTHSSSTTKDGTQKPASSQTGSGAGMPKEARFSGANANVYKQQYQHQQQGNNGGHKTSDAPEEKPQAPIKPKNLKSTKVGDNYFSLSHPSLLLTNFRSIPRSATRPPLR